MISREDFEAHLRNTGIPVECWHKAVEANRHRFLENVEKARRAMALEERIELAVEKAVSDEKMLEKAMADQDPLVQFVHGKRLLNMLVKALVENKKLNHEAIEFHHAPGRVTEITVPVIGDHERTAKALQETLAECIKKYELKYAFEQRKDGSANILNMQGEVEVILKPGPSGSILHLRLDVMPRHRLRRLVPVLDELKENMNRL